MKAPKLPTDRSFGFLFTVVFALIAGWLAWKSSPYWTWSLGVSGAFLLASLLAPRVLRPLNVVWMKFGMLLNRIVSPVVLGIIFFGVVMPFALVMRIAGRDELRRSFDSAARSYWIRRSPPGPDAEQSFPHQF